MAHTCHTSKCTTFLPHFFHYNTSATIPLDKLELILHSYFTPTTTTILTVPHCCHINHHDYIPDTLSPNIPQLCHIPTITALLPVPHYGQDSHCYHTTTITTLLPHPHHYCTALHTLESSPYYIPGRVLPHTPAIFNLLKYFLISLLPHFFH